MSRTTGLCAIAVLLMAGLLASAARSETYRANTPPWRGQWIWAPRNPEAPAMEVDLHRWLLQRPGGWGTALVHRVIGNAAVSGLSGVYWHLEDQHGRRLYPSQARAMVLAWPNWGADFGAVDYPALAAALAKQCDLPFWLVARSSAVAVEAQQQYPGIPVMSAEELTGHATVPASDLDVDQSAKRWLAHDTYRFRRVFQIEQPVERAELTITAQKRYRLFLDGELIGHDSDWWRGETYDLTSLLTPGEHVLAVEVEPEDALAGLLVNLRWFDAQGGQRLLVTDQAWRCSTGGGPDWAKPGYDDAGWAVPGVVGIEGVGPRFRLKEPWRNPRQPAGSGDAGLPAHRVKQLTVRASVHTDTAQRVVDGSTDDRASWQAQSMPTTLELILPEPTRLREVRIHSGYLQFDGNPSGVSSLKAYRLETFEGGRWVNLVEPVTQAPAYRGQAREEFVAYHAFSPRRVSRLRLVILDSYDTGKRVGCPDKPCVPQEERVCFIREIELIKSFDE